MRSMWLHEQFADGAGSYNTGAALRFTGRGDVDTLRAAIRSVTERHDILRTSVAVADDEPVLVVHDDLDVDVEWTAGAFVDDSDVRSAADAFVSDPFDLERGPLLRFAAFSRSEDDHVVVLAIHHLITDVWSMALLAEEIGQEYQRRRDGRPSEPRRSTSTFAEHVERERKEIQSESAPAHRDFWDERYEAMPGSPVLPYDRPPSMATDAGGGLATRLLDADRVAEIEEIARAAGVRSDEVVLAALLTLLRRYSGNSDTGVVAIKAGRSIRAARTQGCFVNPVPVPLTIESSDTLVDVAAAVGAMNRSSAPHDRYPAAAATGAGSVQPGRSPGPSGDVAFIWHKTPRAVDGRGLLAQAVGEFGASGELAGREFQTVPLPGRPTPYALGVLATPFDGGLALAAEYRRTLFDPATVELMLGHLEGVISAAAANPSTTVARLSFMDESDWATVESPDGTHDPVLADGSVIAAIERHAVEHPDRLALVTADSSWTYSELLRATARLDASIRSAGMGDRRRIALLLPRSARAGHRHARDHAVGLDRGADGRFELGRTPGRATPQARRERGDRLALRRRDGHPAPAGRHGDRRRP